MWQNEYATRLYEDNYICCVLVQPQNVAEFELKCRMLQPEHARDQIEFFFWCCGFLVKTTSSTNVTNFFCTPITIGGGGGGIGLKVQKDVE